MKRNIKRIRIYIPNEVILRKVTKTPTLANLVRTHLQVGNNEENVNHFQFSEIERMYTIAGCTVTEV